MAFDHRMTLASPTGALLNLHIGTPAGPVRAVVQVNHGLAEHAARYGRFAALLTAHGFAVYAHDHRGHGYTTAPDAPLGRFAARDGAAKVLADVVCVHDRIARDHPGRPVVLFGHSMGGLIAMNFLAQHADRVQAAAIWNANFSAGFVGHAAKAILAWEKFRLGSDMPSRILPRLTFQNWGRSIPDHRTPFDWLSRDPVEVERYIADPLCGWDASISMWLDIFDLVFAGADDRRLSGISRRLPLNLVGGACDPATEGGKAVLGLAARLRRMGFSNLVSRVYPDTRHDSLNELNRNIIMQDFLDWLHSRIS